MYLCYIYSSISVDFFHHIGKQKTIAAKSSKTLLYKEQKQCTVVHYSESFLFENREDAETVASEDWDESDGDDSEVKVMKLNSICKR